jgi:hypothetical protein
MPLTKTTRLQAINTMLSVIGETPVSSTTAPRADAQIANNILDEVTREVLSYGWHFNTERDVEWTPETSTGYIYVADPITRVDIDAANTEYDVTVRYNTSVNANLLYNLKDNSYVFGAPVKVMYVILIDFDQLPEEARRYIFIRAARIFQDRVVGSEKIHGFTQMDEVQALARLQEFESDTGDYSIFQSYDVARTFIRRGSYWVT